LGKTRQEVVSILTKVLEGHQRQILGTLTVEELYRDRQAFSQRVKGHTSMDLHRMGFVLVSYTVAKIFDRFFIPVTQFCFFQQHLIIFCCS
jgi:flotillin